jgi:hypothetical protein
MLTIFVPELNENGSLGEDSYRIVSGHLKIDALGKAHAVGLRSDVDGIGEGQCVNGR